MPTITNMGQHEREGGSCPKCGALAEHRTCADCGCQAFVIDCGHYPQPRPIAQARFDGSDDHKLFCDKCAKCNPWVLLYDLPSMRLLWEGIVAAFVEDNELDDDAALRVRGALRDTGKYFGGGGAQPEYLLITESAYERGEPL